MRERIFLFIIPLLTGAMSCSRNEKDSVRQKSPLYLDSMSFRYYKENSRPYLLSSTTYAYSDSMSQMLDGADLKLLEAMNDMRYGELSYEQHSDTIRVGLIYSRTNSMFVFGELRTVEDSIFISFSGDSYKKLPMIAEQFKVPYRFYRSQFEILVDTNKKYLIFFRR